MRLKILGVFKKPPVNDVKNVQKNQPKNVEEKKETNEDYHIISTETVPREFYCELPPKVREQLLKNLVGGVDYYSNPPSDIPSRRIISAI